MYGLEDYEGIQPNESLEGLQNEGLSEAQLEYMRELQVPASEWHEMQPQEQLVQMNDIIDRYSELGCKTELDDVFESVYGSEMYETYQNMELLEQVEAPNDIEQIEQISDVVSSCDELRYENWENMSVSEKAEAINQLEQQIAQIECRPACQVRFAEMEPNEYGGYGGNGDITLNECLLENDIDTYKELIDTIVHEGRHAYQDYNMHVQEVHPRHSEVESWRDTWGDGEGKWTYWSDCRTELGQRLYEQQSIEIDARNFAGDVILELSKKGVLA